MQFCCYLLCKKPSISNILNHFDVWLIPCESNLISKYIKKSLQIIKFMGWLLSNVKDRASLLSGTIFGKKLLGPADWLRVWDLRWAANLCYHNSNKCFPQRSPWMFHKLQTFDLYQLLQNSISSFQASRNLHIKLYLAFQLLSQYH